MFLKSIRRIDILSVLIALAFLTACNNETCDPAPDVSSITTDVKVKRFDQDLFNLDTANMANSIAQLREEYGAFPDFYFELMGFRVPKEPEDSLYNRLKGFINFKTYYDTTQVVYGDLADIEAELSQAFKYFKHYLPNQAIPDVYAMYSEFSYGVILPPVGNSCVVSLESFFGPDYELYYSPQINLPYYITRTLNRDHMATKILYAIVEDVVNVAVNNSIKGDSTAAAPRQPATTLLDYMLLNGKKLYLLDQLLPCTPDSVKLGYTKAQTDWVQNSEVAMWGEVFVNQLYDTDYKGFQKFISLSPNSPEMPMEAPGNTGSYVGMKIIDAFMKRNPNYTMEQMLQLTDAQKILKLSKYKPR